MFIVVIILYSLSGTSEVRQKSFRRGSTVINGTPAGYIPTGDFALQQSAALPVRGNAAFEISFISTCVPQILNYSSLFSSSEPSFLSSGSSFGASFFLSLTISPITFVMSLSALRIISPKVFRPSAAFSNVLLSISLK